ncbi:MAG: hypothetical protein SVU32_08810, partial [Candidatus Nanohaloarchaea archaeon]|nr:hypothetical protein [Candidatus Nanohaloarchaea archaeon]
DAESAGGSVYLFSSAQAHLQPEHPDSYTDFLAEVFEESRELQRLVEEAGPLRLDFEYGRTPESFEVRTEIGTLQDADVEEAYNAIGEALDLDVVDLKQGEDLSETTASVAAGDTDVDVLAAGQELFRTEEKAIRYQRGDTTGYLFNPEEPLLVTIGEDDLLFGERKDWMQDDLDTVIEEFNSGRYDGLLLVDQEELRREINKRSEQFFRSFVEENVVDDGEYSGYETLKNFEVIDAKIPSGLEALRALEEHHDFGIESSVDREKLRYLIGSGGEKVAETFMQRFADDIGEAAASGTDISVRRLQGLEESIGDIERKYLDWMGEYRSYSDAEDVVDDLAYNREALERFCREYQERLEGDDGYFVSALINNLDAEDIELPDMHAVDYIGYRNEGTDIDIDGDAGNKLGYEMKEGRIEVHGSLKYHMACHHEDCEDDYHVRTGVAGREMEGGEIYIHGEYDSISTGAEHGGTVYTKESHWVRDDSWKVV